jgi:serine/threonine protein kinase
MKSIIIKMLNQDPDKRPSSDDLLKSFLQSDSEKEEKRIRVENENLKQRILELEEEVKLLKKDKFL